MSNVKLDTTHDLAIEANNLVILEDTVDLVVQKLRQRLKFFFGEWFLDRSEGIPYFQELLGKRPDPARIDAILKTEILDVPGVIELEEFETDFTGSSREASIRFTVNTEDGPVTIEETIP